LRSNQRTQEDTLRVPSQEALLASTVLLVEGSHGGEYGWTLYRILVSSLFDGF